jgi:hypothetical protein
MTGPDALHTAHHELQAYTLGLGDATFIHQHVVDAWTAQTATAATKPIGLTFALAGLYLHLERGLTGREVQLVHIAMAREKRQWPLFPLPAARGDLTPVHVMAAAEGAARHEAIDRWCAAVWTAYGAARAPLIALLDEYAVAIDRIIAARR